MFKRRILELCCLIIAPFLIADPCRAHDLDGDGKDEVLAVSKNGSGVFVWRWYQSSDGQLKEITFGSANNLYPCPGNYLGNGVLLCYIDSDNFWTVRQPDETTVRVNFGLPQVTFVPGADVNGDGITDLSKFLNRCSNFTKSCRTYPITGIFLMSSFLSSPSLQSGIYTTGLVNVFFMDADGDGADDVCSLYPLASKPTDFRVVCRDVLTRKSRRDQKIGEIFSRPIGVARTGAGGYVALSRVQGSRTKFVLVPAKGARISFSINAVGTILSDNWLGSAQSDQIGVVSGGILNYFDPSTRSTGTLAVPEGDPYDTKTQLLGGNEDSKLTTPIVKKNLGRLGFPAR